MHVLNILTLALASFALAAKPKSANNDNGKKIALDFQINHIHKKPVYEKVQVQLYKLTSVGQIKATEVMFDNSTKGNGNMDGIQCRVYSDKKGMMPIGNAFTDAKPMKLGTLKSVKVGSVLCYVYQAEKKSSSTSTAKTTSTVKTTSTATTKTTSTETSTHHKANHHSTAKSKGKEGTHHSTAKSKDNKKKHSATAKGNDGKHHAPTTSKHKKAKHTQTTTM